MDNHSPQSGESTTLKIQNNTHLSSNIKKPRYVKKVANPIFDQCAELIRDPFWVNIYREAAKGKFYTGFVFQNGILKYRKGTKINTIELSTIPEQALLESKEFFSKFGYIVSEKDRYDCEVKNSTESTETLTLKKIRKNKFLFECYLQEYVERVSFKYNREALRYIVMFGFNSGILEERDFVFKNNRIVDIHNIFEIDGVYFVNPSKMKLLIDRKKTAPKPKGVPEMILWNKCLSKFRKECSEQ